MAETFWYCQFFGCACYGNMYKGHCALVDYTRSLGALRAKLLAGGLSGLLSSTFGRSGRETHAEKYDNFEFLIILPF